MGERPAGQLVNGLIVSEPRRGPDVTSSSVRFDDLPSPAYDDSFYRAPVDRRWSRSRGLIHDNGYDSSDAAVEWVCRVTSDGTIEYLRTPVPAQMCLGLRSHGLASMPIRARLLGCLAVRRQALQRRIQCGRYN